MERIWDLLDTGFRISGVPCLPATDIRNGFHRISGKYAKNVKYEMLYAKMTSILGVEQIWYLPDFGVPYVSDTDIRIGFHRISGIYAKNYQYMLYAKNGGLYAKNVPNVT